MNKRRINNWLSILNEADESQPVELLIYDQIGKDWFDNSGVDAKAFAETLKGIPAHRDIVIAINSPGGNVWDGLAIYHQLQARKERVSTRIDGIAASIASIIALAGRETRMPKNALMMIHDPSGLVIGTSADMRKMADELDKHADVLAGIYAAKSGEPATAWRRRMRDETWFTGAEAMDAKLADTVTDEVALAANFNLSRFRRVPAALQSTNPASSSVGKTPKTMNRQLIIAMLAKHGINVAEDAADQVLVDELNKLVEAKKITAKTAEDLTKPSAAFPPVAPTAIDPNRIANLESQLKAERERRITGELDQLCAENPLVDRAEWLPRVLADETLMATLRKMPKPLPGAEPVRATVTNLGNPLLKVYSEMKPGSERNAFRMANFQAMQRARREFAPQNINTIDAALLTDWLSDGLVVVANNKLAALNGFSTDFGVDPMKPRATVQVRKATAAGAVQTNPTNFETGDSTLDNIPVTVAQISRSFHITNDELNSGSRLAHLSQINADAFVNALSDIWTALILDATFAAPAALNVGAASVFDTGVLADIYGTAKNFRSKRLILDGAYVGRILTNINPQAFKTAPQGDRGAFGFDLLAEQNRWTGADANTVGVVCGPESIAVASGLPVQLPSGEFLSLSTISADQIGLTVSAATWFSRSGRVTWASYDVMFGAAAGDTTQLARLKSA